MGVESSYRRVWGWFFFFDFFFFEIVTMILSLIFKSGCHDFGFEWKVKVLGCGCVFYFWSTWSLSKKWPRRENKKCGRQNILPDLDLDLWWRVKKGKSVAIFERFVMTIKSPPKLKTHSDHYLHKSPTPTYTPTHSTPLNKLNIKNYSFFSLHQKSLKLPLTQRYNRKRLLRPQIIDFDTSD